MRRPQPICDKCGAVICGAAIVIEISRVDRRGRAGCERILICNPCYDIVRAGLGNRPQPRRLTYGPPLPRPKPPR